MFFSSHFYNSLRVLTLSVNVVISSCLGILFMRFEVNAAFFESPIAGLPCMCRLRLITITTRNSAMKSHHYVHQTDRRNAHGISHHLEYIAPVSRKFAELLRLMQSDVTIRVRSHAYVVESQFGPTVTTYTIYSDKVRALSQSSMQLSTSFVL